MVQNNYDSRTQKGVTTESIRARKTSSIDIKIDQSIKTDLLLYINSEKKTLQDKQTPVTLFILEIKILFIRIYFTKFEKKVYRFIE